MATPSPNLRIDAPCPILLVRMKKDGDNYSCKSCHKTVIDFRNKTQEEIACSLTSNTCGIFTEDQLPGQQQMNSFRQVCFYVLTLLSFLGFNVKPLSAQTNEKAKLSTDTTVVQTANAKKETDKKDDVSVDKKSSKKEKAKAHRRKKKHLTGCPEF